MSTELEKLVEQIEKQEQVRQALSQLRALIKETGVRQYFYHVIEHKLEVFTALLHHEDAKTRKNAALILGDIADVIDSAQDAQEDWSVKVMKALYEAYEEESQLFVKTSYLVALQNYDYRAYLTPLRNRKEVLSAMDVEENDRKHINEELHQIDTMVIAMEGLQKHSFTGENVLSELVLLTNRKHVDFVANQICELLDVDMDDGQVKTFSAGILVRTEQVEELMKLRTFHEMLYQVRGMKSLSMDWKEAAEQIAGSELMKFLGERHEDCNAAPYYFRIELKSQMDLGQKSTFVKKLSSEIEKLSKGKLVNNKSHYELEIRLIETKTGKFNCLVKLYTQQDARFAYRKKSVAASMKPENAALLIALSKEYMIEDARVLDPFCGNGTMLIERQMVMKANTSYGIDIYGDAIEAAKVNTEAAGQIIHYINKDYFDFSHEYLFDEIVTDMPFETGHKDSSEIEEIYRRFFAKAGENLTTTGRIFLYTHHRELVEQYGKQAGYQILCHEIILEKAGTDLYILEKK